MRYEPFVINAVITIIGALSVAAGEQRNNLEVSRCASDEVRLYQLERQVDALMHFHSVRWPKEAVDAGYDLAEVMTWENSVDVEDGITRVRIKLDLTEPRIVGLAKANVDAPRTAEPE